jgi:hypothetical protein
MKRTPVHKPKFFNHLKFWIFLGLITTVKASFADDVLSGAEEIVKTAYNGSIKTYLYIGEGIAAVMALIFTRNIKALGGVGAVAIFLNVVAKLAGI